MFSFPWWLSLLIGFLSLSVEILWVRVVGFAFQTIPLAFSFVLACYLAGIAFGAAYGKHLCARSINLYAAASVVLAIAAALDALTPMLIATVIWPSGLHLLAFAVVIIAVAAVKSVLFPIAHHLGSVSQGNSVGRSVSRIYFGNIIGATLGPLVTGFLALDHLNVDECFALAGAASLLMSLGCVAKGGQRAYIAAPVAAAALIAFFAAQIGRPGAGSLAVLTPSRADLVTHFISNRHGVIHTARTPEGDYVFGNNVYDGIASVDVDANANRLDRLYLLALVQPHPQQVLVIGVSAGAWVRCLQGFPGLERIDAIEINPGYLSLIQSYPDIAPLLHDPRLRFHIDDGRRWLRRHPAESFDLIIQNTSYFWRANAGNLLSREYFTELRRHLRPGGVVALNTTGSYDVLATAQAVFAYAYRYANFVYMSDSPLQPDAGMLARVRRPDGAPFVPGEGPATSVAVMLARAQLQPAASFIASHGVQARIITDDNLLSEYAHGMRFGPRALLTLLPPAAPEFGGNDP